MTRVNVVPIEILTDQHLFAEYREIVRIPTALRKSLQKNNARVILDKINNHYILGTGHMTFFFNKIKFIQNRHNDLLNELKKRNYKVSENFDSGTFNVDSVFYNDYKPDQNAFDLNLNRIYERISTKPEWYKYLGKSIVSLENYKTLVKEKME